ncbi:Uncharacterized protein Fot_40203 [Forsythia ovata]|uniref:Uncharacterized protein n=1 Tax=Forsythia ovata TaxID=205694 RepID=A0ABD1S6S3_9LAMI
MDRLVGLSTGLAHESVSSCANSKIFKDMGCSNGYIGVNLTPRLIDFRLSFIFIVSFIGLRFVFYTKRRSLRHCQSAAWSLYSSKKMQNIEKRTGIWAFKRRFAKILNKTCTDLIMEISSRLGLFTVNSA